MRPGLCLVANDWRRSAIESRVPGGSLGAFRMLLVIHRIMTGTTRLKLTMMTRRRIRGDGADSLAIGLPDHVRRLRFVWRQALLSLVLICTAAAQPSEIQSLTSTGNLDGMRWPNFRD